MVQWYVGNGAQQESLNDSDGRRYGLDWHTA